MTTKIGSTMIDFEHAIVAALDNVYPGLPIKGCLLHICKAMFCHIRSEKLGAQHVNNEEFCND